MDYSKVLEQIKVGQRYVFYSSLLNEENTQLKAIGEYA